MSRRNEFMSPKIWDREYLCNRLRRDDLALIDSFVDEKEDKTVLDFGAGSALYQSMFFPYQSYLRADIEEQSTEKEIVIGTDGILDLPEQSVDLVISLQVLEHVAHVETYLKEASRVLKPGGILWLTTHGMWIYHMKPHDYHRWTLFGLCKEIEPWLVIKEAIPIMGGPAYAIMIYVQLLETLCGRINEVQSRLLNKLTRTQRWGKKHGDSKRIKAGYLYFGTVLFKVLVTPLNLLMQLIDHVTPESMKRNQAAYYRITAQKSPIQ